MSNDSWVGLDMGLLVYSERCFAGLRYPMRAEYMHRSWSTAKFVQRRDHLPGDFIASQLRFPYRRHLQMLHDSFLDSVPSFSRQARSQIPPVHLTPQSFSSHNHHRISRSPTAAKTSCFQQNLKLVHLCLTTAGSQVQDAHFVAHAASLPLTSSCYFKPNIAQHRPTFSPTLICPLS